MIDLYHHVIVVLSSPQARGKIYPEHRRRDFAKTKFKILKLYQRLGRNRFFSGGIVHFVFRSCEQCLYDRDLWYGGVG